MAFSSNAGTAPGLEIWRIEKLAPVPVDAKNFGTFYSGDAYLVLHTYIKGSQKKQDLHFWLGEKSSQDEQGAAAFMTVTLDDQLGGKPVQHREVQGHESPLFSSYFPKGIVYADGGVASAFRTVDPTAYKPRLFQCKGRRTIRCSQVELSSASLNDGDVFILDAGLEIFLFSGKGANMFEKRKGSDVAHRIKDDERGGKATIAFINQGKNEDEFPKFWTVLGGKPASIKPATDDGADEKASANAVQLFKVSDASGSVTVTKVGEAKLQKEQLDPSEAYIVDSGSAVFVWVGPKASAEERKKSLVLAQNYLTENKRPLWTPITRIIAGGETPAFKTLFASWDPPVKIAAETVSSMGSAAAAAKTASVGALYQARQKAGEEKMVDANGKLTVWRIENFKKVLVDASEHGHFYSGDSYIVFFVYKNGTKESSIIYYWQGRASSLDERGTAALLAVELDKEHGGEPVQVRVVQGKEPAHVLSIFKGKFVVHEGGVASGFHNRKKNAAAGPAATRLYQVKGTKPVNTHAEQVAANAASLNSNDAFILVTAGTDYVWYGKGATADERALAKTIAPVLAGGSCVDVSEGSEPDAFWSALGGKASYPSTKELPAADIEPRLFQGTLKGNAFEVEEIVNFHQDDLIDDDIMILDCVAEVFVWIGKGAKAEEREMGLQAALDYVKNAPDGRSADTPVYKVASGNEPPNFTCHFHGWSGSGAAAASSSGAAAERITSVSSGFDNPANVKFTLAQLKSGDVKSADPKSKELYLSDAEFKATFGMDVAGFQKLQKWKQDELKKKFGLF